MWWNPCEPKNKCQSATPDIPRPLWVPASGSLDGRTFGVVLDTSGSMDRVLLAKALGAIASYCMSREVPAVRVVFCDATTYDQGYILPEVIGEKFSVKGRGGTVLQPGIDLLERAEDFPATGPLLIITDGLCDRLKVRREHAYLIPKGQNLPFEPKGKVFRSFGINSRKRKPVFALGGLRQNAWTETVDFHPEHDINTIPGKLAKNKQESTRRR